jgi:hypothetical protein
MPSIYLLAGFAALSALDGILLATGRLTTGESLIVAALAVLTSVYIVRSAQSSR